MQNNSDNKGNSLGGEPVSGNRLLGWIWIVGAALMLKYCQFRCMVTAMGSVEGGRVMEVLRQVN